MNNFTKSQKINVKREKLIIFRLKQARFALKFMTGKKKLPSEDEMMKETNATVEARLSKGYQKHEAHILGLLHKDYYLDLAKTAHIKNIPDVYADIFTDVLRNIRTNPFGFRQIAYKIIDAKKYEKIILK